MQQICFVCTCIFHMFQDIHIYSHAVQIIDPLTFSGLLVGTLSVQSPELVQMPNITIIRNSLERLILHCGKNCSFPIGFDYFHLFPKIKRDICDNGRNLQYNVDACSQNDSRKYQSEFESHHNTWNNSWRYFLKTPDLCFEGQWH